MRSYSGFSTFRSSRARAAWALVLLLAITGGRPLRADPVSALCDHGDESSGTQLIPPNVRLGDDRMRDHMRALIAQSSVAREMLSFIGRAADTLLTVRGNARLLLHGRASGLTRIGRFDDALVVQIEVNVGDRAASAEQAILAHELGHAVEVVALPRVSLQRLGNLLMSRQGHHVPWSPTMRLETAFAEAVEQAVTTEVGGASPAPAGRLATLMAQHGLRCETTAMPSQRIRTKP